MANVISTDMGSLSSSDGSEENPSAGNSIDPTFDGEAQRRAIINRLKRANGQLAGVIAMLEDDRDCREIVTQLSAVSKAIDRAGFKVVSSSMRGCLNGTDNGHLTPDEIEDLFLRLT